MNIRVTKKDMKKRLANRVYAAKVFRFIFKNAFDKLLFVRTLSIKGVRFDLFIDADGKKNGYV